MSQFIESDELGGVRVAYRQKLSQPHNPTLVLLHSFCMAKELYNAQFNDPQFSEAFNLLAIDEIGHGQTSGLFERLTFWDHAEVVLDVMKQLGIAKAYVLGTSQGGFIAARMALLKPKMVQGLILAGTSLYSETTDFCCWDASAAVKGFASVALSDVPTPEWTMPQPISEMIVGIGLGAAGTEEVKASWLRLHQETFKGDEGRKKFLMNMYTLRDRDELTAEQFGSIRLPVLVAHGDLDTVYTVPLTQVWMKELINCSPLELQVIQGGSHYLSGSSPEILNPMVVEFIQRVSKL